MTNELEGQAPQAPNAQGGDQQPVTEPRTFTQAELDAIITDRLSRQKAQFADYGDLKDRAERWAKFEEAQKSELQKANERAEQAEREKDAALSTAQEQLVKARFIAEASAQDVANPDDAYLLANRSAVDVDEAGNIVGVDLAVKALVDAGRLPLRTKPKAPGLDGGAGSGSRGGDGLPNLSAQEEAVARKMGLTIEQYQKAKQAQAQKAQAQ